MSDTNINKLEPQPSYGYTPKGKIEGGKSVGEVPLETKGDLAPVDQLAPSPKMNRPVKTPQIDAPELPIPTPKALRLASTKRESMQSTIVKEGTMKTDAMHSENQGSIVKAIEQNPWLKNKNLLGALLQVSFEVLNNIRDAQFNETEMKRNVEEKMFSLGMENADLAKAMKDKAAVKEFVRAGTSFVNAAIGIIQFGVTSATSNKAEKEMKGKIDVQETKVKNLENQKALVDTPQKADALFLQDTNTYINNNTDPRTNAPPLPNDPNLPKRADPKYDPLSYDADINLEKKKLNNLKVKETANVYKLREEYSTQVRTGFDAVNKVFSGGSDIWTGILTKQEGVMEKDKARNETMIQMFNKLSDSINKSKDDFQSQFDKTTQQLIQMIADINKAHMLGRG